RFEGERPVLCFWLAPFAGLVEQASGVLRAQVPALRQFDLQADRALDTVRNGGVFVSTWQSVAAANQQARRARSRSDEGAALDDLLLLAREQGMQIGCVIDEAHHGFHKAKEARSFFTEVLQPDYTLMLTATPRDADIAKFEQDTGYRVGGPEEWVTLARADGVAAGLLKRGVKLVRFLAKDDDVGTLVDFERTALRECTEMHRHIQRELAQAQITLTPLMLVQVPDGDRAMREAKRQLVEELGFADEAVRIHTAKEPDADLLALAVDPSVEVLIFKMAVALGFDAPRAFTLAALRGARDKDFGIQVIGRLMRVHPLLRRRESLPAELEYGFVFLANAESQEGLLDAGQAIDKLSTQVPELGSQTVITVVGSNHTVQLLRTGESASLLLDGRSVQRVPLPGASDEDAAVASPGFEQLGQQLLQGQTLELFASSAPAGTSPSACLMLSTVLKSDSRRSAGSVSLREGMPRSLLSEYLPVIDGELERRIADHVDFSPQVLGSMSRGLARLLRMEGDVFGHVGSDRETYVLAELDPVQMATKLERQIGLFDLDPRALLNALLDRFKEKLPEAGFALPSSEEALEHALDVVLVRNPKLLRDANRLARMQRIDLREVQLPSSIFSAEPMKPAKRNIYGVFPNSWDSEDERAFAGKLDACEEVSWWHRNPARRPESVALYKWDDGSPFHPDFVVAYRGRGTQCDIALVEIKGPRGWGDPTDFAKANGPAHASYGKCIFVGRADKGSPFERLLPKDGRLIPVVAWDFRQLLHQDL
ncbi:MAG: helicase SNF2, partial [Xanthomonadales bacterium]|nr:helicase SNF2 [Xanthomonadales bacterium]